MELLLERLQALDLVLEPGLLGLHRALRRLGLCPRLLQERLGIAGRLSANLVGSVLLGLGLRPRLLQERVGIQRGLRANLRGGAFGGDEAVSQVLLGLPQRSELLLAATGGIATGNATLTLRNSTVSGNEVNAASIAAGGIAKFSGTVTLRNSTVVNNTTPNCDFSDPACA